jgi:hypothetical protein
MGLKEASRRRTLLAEGVPADEVDFELRLDDAVGYILALAGTSSVTGPLPKPGPNAAQVGPRARWKLRGILKHYAKKLHPFAACVRDNRKRFGPRTEGVCAVVKDLIRGTTHWRGHNNPRDKGAAGLVGMSEEALFSDPEVAEALIDDEVADALYALSKTPDGVATVLAILEGSGD